MTKENGQWWNVRVELKDAEAPDEVIDTVRDLLAEYSPSVGAESNHNLSAHVSVNARTAVQALDAAIKAVTMAALEAGASTTVVGVELTTEEELERLNATPLIPELCGLGEVAEILGISSQRASQLARLNGSFPPAVARLKSGPVFITWQVEAFRDRWTRRPGRPKKATL